MLDELLVAGVDEGETAGGDAVVQQAGLGGGDGGALHIKGPEMAGGSDLACEEKAVVAITSGGIDDGVAGAEAIFEQELSPADGGGQAAGGTGEFRRCHGHQFCRRSSSGSSGDPVSQCWSRWWAAQGARRAPLEPRPFRKPICGCCGWRPRTILARRMMGRTAVSTFCQVGGW